MTKKRLDSFTQHYQLTDAPHPNVYVMTLEECTLPDNHYDAILFYDVLHHVVDEEMGMSQCFRLLREGGVIGIHEGAWDPNNHRLEEKLDSAMARFGTLESPYTIEYLDYLLAKYGFQEVTRYHQVNGLFPAEMGDKSIIEVAEPKAHFSNILTAIKPWASSRPTTRDPRIEAKAKIELIGVPQVDETTKQTRLRIKLTNIGSAVWSHDRSTPKGRVTVALRQGKLGDPDFREAVPRSALPRSVPPGHELEIEAVFQLPEDYRLRPWFVDLVSEQYFWFSNKGTEPEEVTWTSIDPS